MNRSSGSGVGQHALDSGLVGLVSIAGHTVTTGNLGGFLGQDVAFVSVFALDFAASREIETLLSARIRFHLRHSTKCFKKVKQSAKIRLILHI